MSLKRVIDALIYISVALGVILLLQLYVLVPSWLFYSVLIGWVAYCIVAVAVASGRKMAYPVALILAVLTLLTSLPQPTHYSFMAAGLLLAYVTFAFGSFLQIALLVLIPVYLLRNRHRNDR